VADLRERLARTRWPEPATAEGLAQGVPLFDLQLLSRYWAEEYDWRVAEARLDQVLERLGQGRPLCRPGPSVDEVSCCFCLVR
jgi:hypothetical protein